MSHTFKHLRFPMIAAIALVAVGAMVVASAVSSRSSSAAEGATTYTTTLGALNGSGASGTVEIVIDGDQATVTEHVDGLAATFGGNPYPHVQHIHIGAKGECPSIALDTNGDGVISTVEGKPAYGMVNTTLSTSGDTSAAAATTLEVAPSGASFDYERTFTISAESLTALEDGTAVVVVHGLDPSTLSQEAQDAPSELVPELPLAATAPALCGSLAAVATPSTTAPPTTPAPMTPAQPMQDVKPTFTG